jgi:hypothetical protein
MKTALALILLVLAAAGAVIQSNSPLNSDYFDQPSMSDIITHDNLLS